MPTYAILGATGSTGSELLEYLLPNPNYRLHLYARSASKLQSLHPATKTAKNVTAYTGDITDQKLITDCLRGVDAVFMVVATNYNEAGCNVARQQAHAVVAALEALQKEQEQPADSEFQCPTVVLLSSASLNERMYRDKPRIVHAFLMQAVGYVYADVEEATAYVRRFPWIPLIVAHPPALIHDLPRGFRLSEDESPGMLAYADLARAMVQMVEEEGGKRWVGKGVGIVPTGGRAIRANVGPLVKYLSTGLLAAYAPSVAGFARRRGWW